jgi:hypothetical protein
MAASDVTPDTMLVDEYCAPLRIKAIHTRPESSRAQMWTVRDQRTGVKLFRCTGDHKLSFIHQRGSKQHRVEVRCEDYAEMSPVEQRSLRAYRACPDQSVGHVKDSFRISVQAPVINAPLEPFVGIEVASAGHRYQLAASPDCTLSAGLVTSNCAPEVIQRRPYDSTVDNWTLGVLMYILLSGYHPFDVYGECPEPELLQKIMACSYDFDDPVWTNVSPDAKKLIKGLLQLDPSKRLSIDEFLASPWITQGQQPSPVDGSGPSSSPNPLVAERMKRFAAKQFRTMAKVVVASAKFKASLSRSKRARGLGLLSDGSPDYLGLGSGMGSGMGSGIVPSGLGSKMNGSVRSGALPPIDLTSTQAEVNALFIPGQTPLNKKEPGTPPAFESSVSLASNRNTGVVSSNRAVLSVNGLDPLSMRNHSNRSTAGGARASHDTPNRTARGIRDQDVDLSQTEESVEWTRDADGELGLSFGGGGTPLPRSSRQTSGSGPAGAGAGMHSSAAAISAQNGAFAHGHGGLASIGSVSPEGSFSLPQVHPEVAPVTLAAGGPGQPGSNAS